jgi:hypothetical protein
MDGEDNGQGVANDNARAEVADGSVEETCHATGETIGRGRPTLPG